MLPFRRGEIKLTATDTAFRLTYNSMSDPSWWRIDCRRGIAGTLQTIPSGANAVEPADIFVTVTAQRRL
jgi:hypothetical protein